MGWQSLIFFLLLATQAADAFYGAEHRSRSTGKTNYADIEDLLAEAVGDEIELTVISDDQKDRLLSDIRAAASRIREGYWLDNDPSSSLEDENDALYSRDSPNKRGEYFDNLENKSTYAPRKSFYAPSDDDDASVSVEEPRSSRSSRTIDDVDYYPDSSAISDIVPSGSRHTVNSLVANAFEQARTARHVQIPPWRHPKSKVQVPTGQTDPAGPFLPRAAPVTKSHGTYKMVSSPPKRPSASYVSKIRHIESPKSRSMSQPKQWVSGLSPKEPYAPQMAPQVAQQEGRKAFSSPLSSVGGFSKRGTRQQFHEQGVHGPNSYKFGYNTGDRDNPMARYEERDADGVVRGSYSYVDPMGEKKVVHYMSHPRYGFSTNL